MKLVVGLGNPGRKYEGTRHNVGFMILAGLARKFGKPPLKEKFQADVMEAEIGGERALLMTPLTFMNLSGQSVAEAKNFYKIPEQDLLVICDDLNLPLGKLRIRTKGASGGQKGLEDIIRRLGTDDFPRLRVGIGNPPGNWDWADFVLSKFAKDEQPIMDEAIVRAGEAVEAWTRNGIEFCMNHFNKGTGD
jgi:PTH1 family peptidyl-tRNA hydrolase